MQIDLKPSDITLLFAELQPQVLRGDKTVGEGELARAVATVVDIARKLEIPIVSSTVRLGPPEAPVEMIEAVRAYPPVVRNSVGLLDDEAIAEPLERSGRRIVAIGGVSSEIAILHSVLGACRRGYQVYVLTDCCSGLSQRSEAAAFRQMEIAGAHMSNLSSFFTALVPHLDHPAANVVFESLGRYWHW